MATSKPKRATTSSKSTVKKVAAGKPASGRELDRAFWVRTRFIFYVVLIAAALLAITLALADYSWSKNPDSATSSDASATAGTMFLQSLNSAATHKAGDVLSVTLYEDSGNQSVNALQSSVKYPAEKLALVSVQNGIAFSEEAATDTSTPGLVRVARSIKAGSAAVKGAKPVVTMQFKVLSDSDSPFELSVDGTASLLVRASDSQNILKSDDNTTFDL